MSIMRSFLRRKNILLAAIGLIALSFFIFNDLSYKESSYGLNNLNGIINLNNKNNGNDKKKLLDQEQSDLTSDSIKEALLDFEDDYKKDKDNQKLDQQLYQSNVMMEKSFNNKASSDAKTDDEILNESVGHVNKKVGGTDTGADASSSYDSGNTVNDIVASSQNMKMKEENLKNHVPTTNIDKDKDKLADDAAAKLKSESRAASFIKVIFDNVVKYNPNTTADEIFGEHMVPVLRRNDKLYENNALLSESHLSGGFMPDISTYLNSSKIYSDYLNSVKNVKFPLGLYKGKGIVIVGGGSFSWLSLLSVLILRKNGGTLPVEVIIPERESYDPVLCEDYLKNLNAKCVMIPDILGDDYRDRINLSRYQFKGLALLVSSFDDTLLIDSDNLPLTALTQKIFAMEPYLSNKMVLWPDFWTRVTHPFFYNFTNTLITNQKVRDGIVSLPEHEYKLLSEKESLNDVPYHDLKGAIPDVSTESGQVLISKNEHPDVLLLSLYYNTYGPSLFYPLLSQGGPGEGDKDTFPAAANALGKKFYQVKKNVHATGFFYEGSFTGDAMVQFDPIVDFIQSEKYMKKNTVKKEDIIKHKNDKNPYKESIKTNAELTNDKLKSYLEDEKHHKPLFLHANFPKLLPWDLLKGYVIKNKKKTSESEEPQSEGVSEENVEHIQMYNSGYIPKEFEYNVWKIMDDVICQNKDKDLKCLHLFEDIDDLTKREEWCNGIFKRHLQFLKDKTFT
ncbi:hypothetical protein BVG19_g4866 [[Candida] boidinii]|nr:hypothetical protein BVG19_g4866 [[Candida] boidinii]OWB51244.1 hypothetical protein B5S27_g2803 [[Candida] boidinii]